MPVEFKRHYISLVNGSNVFAEAGDYYHNETLAVYEFLLGAPILTSTAGTDVILQCDGDHGIKPGEMVRVINHRCSVPQVDDLIDSTNLHLVIACPSTQHIQLDITTTAAGFGGYVGKVSRDLVRDANVDLILYSNFGKAPEQPQDRIG